jgi:glycerophosphoryl diester phosphodiesterase
MTYADLMTDKALAEVAKYAAGVGPWKNTLLVPNPKASGVNGAGLMSTGLLERIHAAGMQAHPYTWRQEARRLTYGNFTSLEVRRRPKER